MRLTWSRSAVEASSEILRRIIDDGRPLAGLEWLDGLESRVDKLRDAPFQGRVVPEWSEPTVRELIYGSYRVVYSVADEEVVILTVFHSRRTLPESRPEDSA